MLVTCAIIKNEAEILVTQRSEHMQLPLKWEFPGGKVKENETEVDCIVREIKEELGITIRPIVRLRPITHKYEQEITLVPFISEYISGEIILTEHKAYRWLSRSDLLTLDWAAADIHVVHQYLKYKP